MFQKAIGETIFTTSTAAEYFSNITGSAYGGDVTFLSTLRALLPQRMGEGDSLRLSFHTSNSTVGRKDGYIEEIHSLVCPGRNELKIVSISKPDAEASQRCFDTIAELFPTVAHGYKPLDKIQRFFFKSFRTLCFANEETKSTILFVDRMSMKAQHYIQCAVLAMLPWYFEDAESITVDEWTLIKSLREKEPAQYLAACEKLAEKYDFRTIRLKQLLDGFESQSDKRELENITQQIELCYRRINEYNEMIFSQLKEREDLDVRKRGLESKICDGNGESEILDYFVCNKKLHLLDVHDSTLVFCVEDYLTYFDEDMAETLIEKSSSTIYRNGWSDYRRKIDNAQTERLMTAIFLNRELKIRFCAAYEFDILGRVRCRNSGYPSRTFETCMPNPHIHRYSCLGNYERTINQLLTEGNYLMAVEQCVASGKSLNFADSTVLQEFMTQLYSNVKCIELPDGSVVGCNEAVQWLEERDA